MKITMQTNSTPKEIYKAINNGHYKGQFCFEFDNENKDTMGIFDEAFPDSYATLEWHDNGLKITTAWSGYVYHLDNDGVLIYEGPYMGFLEQILLPNFDFTTDQLLSAEVESSLCSERTNLGRFALEIRERFKAGSHPYAVANAFVEKEGLKPSYRKEVWESFNNMLKDLK